MAIRNPIEWGVDQVKGAATAAGTASRDVRRTEQDLSSPVPEVRRIGIEDVRDAVAKGFEDFGERRTDVLFLCVIYPVVGFVLGRVAFGYDMLPLLFPLASGFALVGPIAAVGLYEMSRRREQGVEVSWTDAFGVLNAPSFGSIVVLGLVLMGVFLLWLFVAEAIYDLTLGPEPPVTIGTFVRDVFTTGAGWAMIVLGVGVGFLFAVLVLAISVVSFPMLLDRNVGLEKAVWTSVRAVAENPVPMAFWGMVVAGGLVIGSIPVFLGLIVVMPVLGHATWHLYRKLVPYSPNIAQQVSPPMPGGSV
jgi:uncharacterized membrane protein